MKTVRTFAFLSCFVVLLMASAPKAKASYEDQGTWVTVGEPVELPGGVVLQPGKYFMRVAGYPWSPNLIRITNPERTEVYATFFGKSAYRMKATGETVLILHEAPVGQPRPLCTWFYPGKRIGWEFHPMALATERTISKRELKGLLASATTPEDHRKLAAYYTQETARLTTEAQKHDQEAAASEKNPSALAVKNSAAFGAQHCRNLASGLRKDAAKAHNFAGRHEEMVQQGAA